MLINKKRNIFDHKKFLSYKFDNTISKGYFHIKMQIDYECIVKCLENILRISFMLGNVKKKSLIIS